MPPLVANNNSVIEVQLIVDLQGEVSLLAEAAFAKVYRLYNRYLYGIALKYLKDPALAEDALQDIFLKFWTHRYHINTEQSLKGFLATMMKNHVLNVLRDQKREILRYIEYTLDWSESEGTGEEIKQWDEYSSILQQGISKLSPQKKKVFELRMQSGLKNEEVAFQMGLSINTVKFQFSQALHFLRTYVQHRIEIILFPILFWIMF